MQTFSVRAASSFSIFLISLDFSSSCRVAFGQLQQMMSPRWRH